MCQCAPDYATNWGPASRRVIRRSLMPLAHDLWRFPLRKRAAGKEKNTPAAFQKKEDPPPYKKVKKEIFTVKLMPSWKPRSSKTIKVTQK